MDQISDSPQIPQRLQQQTRDFSRVSLLPVPEPGSVCGAHCVGSWAKARVVKYSETKVHKGKGSFVLFIACLQSLGQFCMQCVLVSYLMNE